MNPPSITGLKCLKNSVSKSVRMCAPSTSASVAIIILWYLSFKISNVSPIAVPKARTKFLICSEPSILSSRALSILRIFPRSGKTACVRRSLPVFAVPPAESPSTINNSLLATSLDTQGTNLPGKLIPLPPSRKDSLYSSDFTLFWAAVIICQLMVSALSHGLGEIFSLNRK